MRRLAVIVCALVLAPSALAWRTPTPGEAIITREVKRGVTAQLVSVTGERHWQTQGRCRVLNARNSRFACAIWTQNLVRSQDFWSSAVEVRCAGPLTECSWRALTSFPGPWLPSG